MGRSGCVWRGFRAPPDPDMGGGLHGSRVVRRPLSTYCLRHVDRRRASPPISTSLPSAALHLPPPGPPTAPTHLSPTSALSIWRRGEGSNSHVVFVFMCGEGAAFSISLGTTAGRVADAVGPAGPHAHPTPHPAPLVDSRLFYERYRTTRHANLPYVHSVARGRIAAHRSVIGVLRPLALVARVARLTRPLLAAASA